MVVDRMAYIVYYHGKDIIKKVQNMSVNLAYISARNNYLIFYGDNNQEKNYFNQIKSIKGFKKLEQSLFFNEETKFEVK